jgi:hypothetical protein
MPRRDGEITHTEVAIIRRPPLREVQRDDLAPGYYELVASDEFKRDVAEGAHVRQHEGTPGAGEILVGAAGPLRWSLLRQFREDAGRTVEEVAAGALLTPAEVEALEAEDGQADGDRERRRLAEAVGVSDADAVFPWQRWRAPGWTIQRPRWSGSPTRRPRPEPAEPERPTLPPSSVAGARAEAGQIAADLRERRQAEMEAEAADIRKQLEINSASEKLDALKRDVAERSKTPMQRARERLRRR